MTESLIVALVGVAAGAVTTVAGFGGGLLVTLALSLGWGPHTALATAAGALLVGNAHRLIRLRRHVDLRVTTAMAVGAFIGAVLGGLVTAALTADTIRWLLVAVSALAVARALGWLKIPAHRGVLFPGGFGVGFVAATTGGGGLLLAPLMLAVGLTDTAFLATGTVVALAVHVGRVGSYIGSGLLAVDHAWMTAILAVGLVAGNALGFVVRERLTVTTRTRATWFVLAVGLVLAIAGVTGKS